MITYIGNDWDKLLQSEYEKKYFKDLQKFLNYEYLMYDVYPPRDQIFNALRYSSYKDTRVVILGQDPYIRPGQAHGLAFSVNPDVAVPPSLINIFKELKEDCNCQLPDNGCLIPWAKQGVLLLNTILTVRRGCSLSHKDVGWIPFTDQIIRLLNQKDQPVIFLLWGNQAKQKASMIDDQMHMVLKAPHPSPLAGNRFLGCKHFSKVNDYLYEITTKTIDWQIPNVRKENK